MIEDSYAVLRKSMLSVDGKDNVGSGDAVDFARVLVNKVLQAFGGQAQGNLWYLQRERGCVLLLLLLMALSGREKACESDAESPSYDAVARASRDPYTAACHHRWVGG